MIVHRPIHVLEAGLENIKKSPDDNGILYMIVVRHNKRERTVPWYCKLSPEFGVEGDHWSEGSWKSLPDGSPDPAVQLTIMNSRLLDLIATEKDRWPLAGDNLIVDLDLSTENLKPGQKLSIGSAILEVSDVPHTGCMNFRERFGVDALRFVSSKSAKELRLRGLYARVIKAGEIRVGDRMRKVES
jgi:MOSC domain-containing protein YiiM